jgi:hypothetical protein
LNLATGAGASLAGGLSSAGSAVENAGRFVLNRFGANLPAVDEGANFRKVMSDLTYKPQSPGAQADVNAISYPSQKLGQFAQYAGGKAADLTGSPAVGAAVDTGIQAVPYALGARFSPKAAMAAAPAEVAPEVAAATRLGLKLTPEQAGAGLPGRIVQSLSGSAKLERSLSKQNAPIVNQAAGADIGITGPLTKSNVVAAKAAPNATYAQVAKLGQIPTDTQYAADIAGIANRSGEGSFAFDVPKSIEELKTGYAGVKEFDAADAVAKVRQLRRDSSANLSARNAPEQNALGYTQRQIADALDNQLDRFVQSQAQLPGSTIPATLIDQLRQARVQLAKINTVQAALKGSNLSAAKLAKQGERVPLNGNLKIIADAYGNFDRSLQDVSKIRDSGPFGVLDLGYGAAAGLAHPAALSAVLARPLARAALASKTYQRLGIQGHPLPPPPVGLLGPTAPLLTQQPALEQQQ